MRGSETRRLGHGGVHEVVKLMVVLHLMNGNTTYTPINLTLSNPQGHYLFTTSLNVHEIDIVNSKSGLE